VKNVEELNRIEKLKNSLNETGFFLQKKIEEILKDSKTAGWALKYCDRPFAYPPRNGPIKGSEGRVDIIAEKMCSAGLGYSFIECKRANPEYCDWVFFPAYEQRQFFYSLHNKKSVGCGSIRISDFHDSVLCDIGVGIKEKGTDRGNRKVADANEIEKVCEQTCHALVGVGVTDLSLRSNDHLQFFPLVITTANLFIAEYDAENIDISNGKIATVNLQLKSVDWIYFNYPMPQYLHFANEISPNFARKATVIIVNSKKAEEFLGKFQP